MAGNSTSRKTDGAAFFAGLCLAAGTLGGWLAGRASATQWTMPHLSRWQKMLARSRGEVRAGHLAARIQHRYNELMSRRPYYRQPALNQHLTVSILPGLALFEVLRDERSDQRAVKTEFLDLFEAILGSRRRMITLMGRIPASFAFFRLATRTLLKTTFPPQGWEIELVEDSNERISFNMSRCFYQDMLAYYGAPELTELFCQLDDLLYEALPASITWKRTQTLGRGDPVCDFCFERKLAA